MRYKMSITASMIVLVSAIATAGSAHAKSSLPPPPTTGICAPRNPKLPVEIATLPQAQFKKPGQHLVFVLSDGTFDIEIAGGGGGGGGARAASEPPGGAGGGHAEFVPIAQHVKLARGYYLVDVGEGGVGGKGGWNWNTPTATSDGLPGKDTLFARCLSGATIAISHGGAAGKGDNATTGNRYGNPGEDLIDPITGRVIGNGGAGGAPGGDNAPSGDGQPGVKNGAGGGGQGATRYQNDGVSHGGKGADGFVKLTKIGN